MIKPIDAYDWPDSHHKIIDGYDERIPALTIENLEFLAERYNELVDAINKLKEQDK